MLGLSMLGVIHTLISLAALGAGIACLAREGAITPRRPSGALYVALTVLSAATSLGIFAHGGFGKPHVLALATLATLAIAVTARATAVFGRRARAVETVAYSATILFHMIPGVTETFTRLPRNRPLFNSPDAPGLQAVIFVMLVLFVVGAWYQVRRLGKDGRRGAGASRRAAGSKFARD